MTAFPELLAIGHREAELYVASPGEVCISITSPKDLLPRLDSGFREILRLAFDDDSVPGWQQRNRIISPADADRVVEFVQRHRNAPRIVVHCYVGASRSVSLALAIARCNGIYWRPRWWEDMVARKVVEPDYIPNQGVYDRVCEAFVRRKAVPA